MDDLFEVLDPRPNAASAPYTFFLPDPELIKAVCKGDHVKAIIRAVPPSEKYDAERMWIRVTSTQPDWIEGTLDSQPHDKPKLPGSDLASAAIACHRRSLIRSCAHKTHGAEDARLERRTYRYVRVTCQPLK